MRSILFIFCLWMCFSIGVSTTNANCYNIPEVENAEISLSSRKDNYSSGDRIDFTCDLGYTAFKKITYICSDGKWFQLRGEKCSLKRCELPADIPNGRIIMVNGNHFVFGTTIKYICNDGYQMMSRSDTRTCRDGGWDNHLPECEEVQCAPFTPEANVRVDGLPDYEEMFRYGHRLTFSCLDRRLIIKGPDEITCQSNGKWSSPIPKCVEPRCQLNTTAEDVKIEGLPDIEGPVKPGHKLRFSCNGEGLRLKGQKEVTCQSNGEWSSSFPECEEIVCEAKLTANMRSDVTEENESGPEISVKPGKTVTVSCVGKGWRLHGNGKVTCQSTGEWSSPFPQCKETKCKANLTANMRSDVNEDEHLGSEISVRPGKTVTLSCVGKAEKLQGPNAITCMSTGQWDVPLPKCEGEKCGPPPTIKFADTTDLLKIEYKAGEKAEYNCAFKYILDLRHPYSDHLTCVEGQWTGSVKCLKPCTVTVEEMDQRRIQLKKGGRAKIFSEHDDHLTFVCNWFKSVKFGPMRQKCNDGVMNLPECW